MAMTRTIRLTKEDAQELLHRLTNLWETDDLMEDYNVTSVDIEHLMDSVPQDGGTIDIPEHLWSAVHGEMMDHANLLRGIADDARNNDEPGQALRMCKQAKRLEAIFDNTPPTPNH